MTPIYNKAQYKFLYDKWCQGYAVKELADWAGITPETLRRNFARHGFRANNTTELPPLSSYKAEFNKLGTVR